MFNKEVMAGAAYLDSVKPGWEKEIDLDKLNIASCFNCVLGQVFGDYIDYLHDKGLPVSWAARHGFTAYPRMNTGSELTPEWKEFIQARLEEVPVPEETEKELVLV